MKNEAGGQAASGHVSDTDLLELETMVSHALRTRDLSQLNVLGFGEISIALGVPADEPSHVCKRTPPFAPDQFRDYRALVRRYIDELDRNGVDVVDTDVRSVEREGRILAYLTQPLLPSDTLGHNVLGRSEPDADHPFLVALSETIGMASASISIDAQVTNWSWDGSTLTLVDVGSPFLWDDRGVLQLDMSPYLPMIPAPLRSAIHKDLVKMVDRWKSPRGVAIDLLANLQRAGLTDWLVPALEALNRTVGGDNPIEAAEADAVYTQDLKTWPRLLRLKRIERAWQTTVRRRPYDFFIQSTYAGDRTY